MYREIHELPYQSGLKEKFISLGPFSFSLGESAWVGFGVMLCYQMTKYVPTLPFLSFPWKYVHYLIPLIATFFFSRANHPSTGIPLWKYMIRWIQVRTRQRVYYYLKVNTVKGGDRYI